MALDIQALTSQMLAAALPILKKDAQDAESFAKTELTKIAQTMASIEAQLAVREIDQQQASLLLDMQTHASRNVLLTLKGLALVAAEAAINAALGAVKTAVNTAVGFTLI
jgi:hypothetical protein